MPTYDYTCTHCKHVFEERQKITDAPLLLCPQCNKKSLQRGIGGGSAIFRFMGNGFYITDYKKERSCSDTNSACTSNGPMKAEANSALREDAKCCPCENKD